MSKLELNIDNLIEEKKLAVAEQSYPFAGIQGTEEKRENWLKEKVLKSEEDLIYSYLGPSSFEGVDTLSVKLAKNYLTLVSDFEAETFSHSQLLREQHLRKILTSVKQPEDEAKPSSNDIMKVEMGKNKQSLMGNTLLNMAYSLILATNFKNYEEVELGLANLVAMTAETKNLFKDTSIKVINLLQVNLFTCIDKISQSADFAKEQVSQALKTVFKIGKQIYSASVRIYALEKLISLGESLENQTYFNLMKEFTSTFSREGFNIAIPEVSPEDLPNLSLCCSKEAFFYTVNGRKALYKATKVESQGEVSEMLCLNQNVEFSNSKLFIAKNKLIVVELKEDLKITTFLTSDLSLVKEENIEIQGKIIGAAQGFDYAKILSQTVKDGKITLHLTTIYSESNKTEELDVNYAVEEMENLRLLDISIEEAVVLNDTNKNECLILPSKQKIKVNKPEQFLKATFCYSSSRLYNWTNNLTCFISGHISLYSMEELRMFNSVFDSSIKNCLEYSQNEAVRVLFSELYAFACRKNLSNKAITLENINGTDSRMILINHDAQILAKTMDLLKEDKPREIQLALLSFIQIILDQKQFLGLKLEKLKSSAFSDYLLKGISQETSDILGETLMVKCFQVLERFITLSEDNVSQLLSPEIIEKLIQKETSIEKVSKLFSIVFNQMDKAEEVLRFTDLLFEFEFVEIKRGVEAKTKIEPLECLTNLYSPILANSQGNTAFLAKFAKILLSFVLKFKEIYDSLKENKSFVLVFNKTNLMKCVFLVVQMVRLLEESNQNENLDLIQTVLEIYQILRQMDEKPLEALKEDFTIHTLSTEHPLEKESGRQVNLPSSKYFFKFGGLSSLSKSSFSLIKGEENQIFTLTFPKETMEFEGEIKLKYQSHNEERKDCYGMNVCLSNYDMFRRSNLIGDTCSAVIDVLMKYFFEEKLEVGTESASRAESKLILKSKLFRNVAFEGGIEAKTLLTGLKPFSSSSTVSIGETAENALWDKVVKENMMLTQNRKKEEIRKIAKLSTEILVKRLNIAENDLYPVFKKVLSFTSWLNQRLILFTEDMEDQKKLYLEQIYCKLNFLLQIIQPFDDEVEIGELVKDIEEILKNESVTADSLVNAFEAQNKAAIRRLNAWFLVNKVLESTQSDPEKREILTVINFYERQSKKIVNFSKKVQGSDTRLGDILKEQFFSFYGRIVEECCKPQSLYQYIFLFQALLWVMNKRDIPQFSKLDLFKVFEANKAIFQGNLDSSELCYDYSVVNKNSATKVLNQVFLCLASQILRMKKEATLERSQSCLSEESYTELTALFVVKVVDQIESQISADFDTLYVNMGDSATDQERLHQYLLMLYKLLLFGGEATAKVYEVFTRIAETLVKGLFVVSDNNKVLLINILRCVQLSCNLEEAFTCVRPVFEEVKHIFGEVNKTNFFFYLALLFKTGSNEVVSCPVSAECITKYLITLILDFSEGAKEELLNLSKSVIKKGNTDQLELLVELFGVRVRSPRVGDNVQVQSAFIQRKEVDTLLDVVPREGIKTGTILGFTSDSNNPFVIDDTIVSFLPSSLSMDNSLKYAVVVMEETLSPANIQLYNYDMKHVLTDNLKLVEEKPFSLQIQREIAEKINFDEFIFNSFSNADHYTKMLFLKVINSFLPSNQAYLGYSSKPEFIQELTKLYNIARETDAEILCLEEYEFKNRTELRKKPQPKKTETKPEKALKLCTESYSIFFKQEDAMIKEYPFERLFNLKKTTANSVKFSKVARLEEDGAEGSVLMADSGMLLASAEIVASREYSFIVTDDNFGNQSEATDFLAKIGCPVVVLNGINFYSLFSYIFEMVPNEDMEQLFLYSSSVDFTSFIEIPVHLVDDSVKYGQRDLVLKIINEKKGKPVKSDLMKAESCPIEKLIGMYAKRILLTLVKATDCDVPSDTVIDAFRSSMFELSQMGEFQFFYDELPFIIREFLGCLSKNEKLNKVQENLTELGFLSSNKLIGLDLVQNMRKEAELLTFQNLELNLQVVYYTTITANLFGNTDYQSNLLCCLIEHYNSTLSTFVLKIVLAVLNKIKDAAEVEKKAVVAFQGVLQCDSLFAAFSNEVSTEQEEMLIRAFVTTFDLILSLVIDFEFDTSIDRYISHPFYPYFCTFKGLRDKELSFKYFLLRLGGAHSKTKKTEFFIPFNSSADHMRTVSLPKDTIVTLDVSKSNLDDTDGVLIFGDVMKKKFIACLSKSSQPSITFNSGQRANVYVTQRKSFSEQVYFYGAEPIGVGSTAVPNTEEAHLSQELTNHKVKQIVFGAEYTLVLTKGNKVLCHGRNTGSSLKNLNQNYSEFTEINHFNEIAQENGVKMLASNSKNTSVILTLNDKIFGAGVNTSGMLSKISDPETNSNWPSEFRKIETESEIVKVVLGDYNSLVLTAANELFCLGSNAYNQTGNFEHTDLVRDYFKIQVPGVKKVLDVVTSSFNHMLLVETELNQRQVLVSGVEDVSNYNESRRSCLETLPISASKIFGSPDNIGFLDTKGKLFINGKYVNESQNNSKLEETNFFTPNSIADVFVLEAHFTVSNIFVIGIHDMEKKVYVWGKNENNRVLQGGNDMIPEFTEVNQLTKLRIDRMFSSETRQAFVVMNEEKKEQSVEKAKKGKKMKSVSKLESLSEDDKKRVLFFNPYGGKQIELDLNLKLPSVEEKSLLTSSLSGEEINGIGLIEVCTMSCIAIGELSRFLGDLQEPTLFYAYNSEFMNEARFKAITSIERSKLDVILKVDRASHLIHVVTPEKKHKEVLANSKDPKIKEMFDFIKTLSNSTVIAYISLLEAFKLKYGNSKPAHFENLRQFAEEQELVRYKPLKNMSIEQLSLVQCKREDLENLLCLLLDKGLGEKFSFLSELMTGNVILLPIEKRRALFRKNIDRLIENADGGSGNITVNRFKVRKFYEKGEVDLTGENTLFGQVHSKMKKMGDSVYRCSSGRSLFRVTFVGEGAVDAGGPYRELLSGVFEELQTCYLPIFVKTPNNKADAGSMRDKYILRGGANTESTLSQLEFLGKMMGFALCSGFSMGLDLHPVVWKLILGEEINFADLESVDKYFFKLINELEKKEVTEDELRDVYDLTFTVPTLEGGEMELKEGGSKIEVRLNNYKEFIELAKERKLNELSTQIEAVKQGLQ